MEKVNASLCREIVQRLVAEFLLDTAIYHCQQAAEKSLKGWLTFHDLRFEKTHDLRMLATLAAGLDADFLKQLDTAELLTPFSETDSKNQQF